MRSMYCLNQVLMHGHALLKITTVSPQWLCNVLCTQCLIALVCLVFGKVQNAYASSTAAAQPVTLSFLALLKPCLKNYASIYLT